MKDTKKKIIITIIGILLNISGRAVAGFFKLPIWFDMTGTFVATYFAGIWGGIAAGIFNSILSSFFDVTALAYSLTSVVAALMTYLFVKNGYMDNLLRAVVSTFWLGIICTIVSTHVNLIFYGGYSGNIWGDTLVDMLRWNNVNLLFSSLAGDAVVEIVDKQICVLAAFIFIRAFQKAKNKKNDGTKAALICLMAAVTVLYMNQYVHAENEESSLLQDNMVAKVYNNTNGMVSSEANAICETEDGYIWIGSYAGLTRYDGTKFEFIREGGLVNVTGMMTDSCGRLWIGTNDAGIARYENGEYTYFTIEDGLPSNSIRCFAEDDAGNVYVGTSDKICRFSQDDTIEILQQDITFAKYMEVYKNMLVVLDNKGCIYAIDGNKILKMNGTQSKFFYYCMAKTQRGLMAGTDTGELFVLDISDKGLYVSDDIDIEASTISTLFEDSSQKIWIALESGFGYMESDGTFNKMYYEDFPSSIVCFHEDYQGNIWIASSKYGVMQLSESSFINLFEKNGLYGKVVNAVVYFDGDYYCGTDDGLVILDGKNYISKTNELTERMTGYRIRSLAKDSKERLWLCTYNGLWCYEKDGALSCYNVEKDKTTSDRFRCMTELKNGMLVAGTADGINYFKDGQLKYTVTSDDGLANTQILSVVEAKDGNVWAGSDGSGIYVLSDGKLIKTYTVEDGLSSNIILRIVPYDKGYLIVTSNALCHIDEEGNVKKLGNFPYFNNYDIIIDGDTAYITCSAGLYEVSLSDLCEDKQGRFMLYGANQGLFSGLTANSWNYLDDSRLFLCSNNGVIVFNGENAGSNVDMKYGVCSVECDGITILPDGDGHFMVPGNTKGISIEASVRNYAFAKNKVRFFIKELDDNPIVYDWNEVEPIRLFKSDFSCYHICLQLLDGSGENVLSEKEYIIDRQMHTWEEPVYRTYLMIVCLEILIFTIISIVSMILFIVRKNELEKNQIELEQRVNEQTMELSSQQKKIKNILTQTVIALSEAVDAKDRYTSGHSKRVAEYALMLAERMGKSKEEQEEIYRAGLLHDVGKIRIPSEIINKVGKLTDEEFNIIKIHPVTGYHILRGISEDNMIAIAAKYHHERYDGMGYPNGLVGEKIPEIARILAVADAYDAMASNRSYRDALPQEVVRSEIEKGMGTQFDPKIAQIMLDMIDEDKTYILRQEEAEQKRILTVDDDIMNHKIIEHIMSDEPIYKIVSAYSGRMALEILEQQEFDLILLDLMMPEMNGLETLKLIREKYDTPVVIMTSDKTLDTSVEFAAYGCDEYITKPFLPLLIKEVVHNMTERTNIEE